MSANVVTDALDRATTAPLANDLLFLSINIIPDQGWETVHKLRHLTLF